MEKIPVKEIYKRTVCLIIIYSLQFGMNVSTMTSIINIQIWHWWTHFRYLDALPIRRIDLELYCVRKISKKCKYIKFNWIVAHFNFSVSCNTIMHKSDRRSMNWYWIEYFFFQCKTMRCWDINLSLYVCLYYCGENKFKLLWKLCHYNAVFFVRVTNLTTMQQ